MADDVFPLNKSGAEIQRLLNLMNSREELMAYFAGLKTTDTDPDQLMGNGWYFIQKNHIVDPVLVNSGGGFIFNARGDFSDYTRVQLFVPLDVSEGIKYRTYTATNTRSPWTDILNRTDTNLITSGVAADAAAVGTVLATKFGYVRQLTSSDNLNEIKTPEQAGFYRWNSNGNRPLGCPSRNEGALLVFGNDGFQLQIVVATKRYSGNAAQYSDTIDLSNQDAASSAIANDLEKRVIYYRGGYINGGGGVLGRRKWTKIDEPEPLTVPEGTAWTD